MSSEKWFPLLSKEYPQTNQQIWSRPTLQPHERIGFQAQMYSWNQVSSRAPVYLHIFHTSHMQESAARQYSALYCMCSTRKCIIIIGELFLRKPLCTRLLNCNTWHVFASMFWTIAKLRKSTEFMLVVINLGLITCSLCEGKHKFNCLICVVAKSLLCPVGLRWAQIFPDIRKYAQDSVLVPILRLPGQPSTTKTWHAVDTDWSDTYASDILVSQQESWSYSATDIIVGPVGDKLVQHGEKARLP